MSWSTVRKYPYTLNIVAGGYQSVGMIRVSRSSGSTRILGDRLTLMMESLCSSETSVTTFQCTRRHIPEDLTIPTLVAGYIY